MKSRRYLSLLVFIAILSVSAIAEDPECDGEKVQCFPNGLKVEMLQEGNGKFPQKGSQVEVHYTGKLTNGEVFDSSVKRGQTFKFTLGVGQVIKCWDEGIAKLSIGAKAVLTCPYQIAYGERGHPPVIPPKSTLLFEVELFGFKGPAGDL